MRRCLVICVALLAVTAAVGAAAPHESAYVGYPNSIAVLGHSGATGENSDPKRPGVEVRNNSWATGTNPAVRSVYLRTLAKNPKIKGHNFNLAHGGATVQQLVFQAQEAVSLKADLVLIQIMDSDIVCPATKRDYNVFRATLVSALETLTSGAPESSIFVVSQFGSPGTYARSLTLAQRRAVGASLTPGPCAFIDPSGRIVPKEVARLDKIIHGYETQLRVGCTRFSQCRYDGGAFGRIVDKREYGSSDLNHFSIKGHAKAAAVAWAAMKRAGLVPRTRSVFSAPAGDEGITTSPGKNGRIAFKHYLDSGRSTGAIFTIDASGSAQRQVTKPASAVVDDQPDWSPTGSLLVFHRGVPVPGSPFAIYTVKPDGSDTTRLSPPCPAGSQQCEDGQYASFLPDGRRVVYTRSTGKVRHFRNWDQIEHSDIVVKDVNGADPRVLIRSRPFAGDFMSAHFSPDGSRLVYVRANSPLSKPALKHALFVATADGGEQRQITPWSLDGGDDPDWSPNGKLILFRSHESFGGEQSQIYVVRPNGSGLRSLTRFNNGTTVLSSSFSPDGKWISFSKVGRAGRPDVFVMRVNGTQVRPVTRSPLWDSAPDWGPR